MRFVCAALVAAYVCCMPALADSSDLLEPRVLLGDEAAALAAAIYEAGGGKARPGTDIAVVLFEPAGLVRLVLINTAARRKVWLVISIEQFARLIQGLGESV